MRTTLAMIKASRIPAVLGVCATDARLIQWVNEATQRLLFEGKWFGTYAKYRMCATDGCLTMPPQVAAIEAVAICHRPVPVHDQWFEFMENGAGTRNGESCWSEANQRGNFPTFRDVQGVDKKITVVCDLVSDVAKTILLLGYDQNGNWIRTQQSGVWSDGELVTFAQSPGTTTTNLFSSVTGVQIQAGMNGQSWLYTKSTSDSSLIQIGHYQYFETNPSYPRYFFPSLVHASAGACGSRLVEAMCKLDYIPVAVDTDYPIIGNIPALKEMCLALMKAENEPDSLKANQIIAAGTTTAKRILDTELDHFLGSGRRIGFDFVGSSVGGSDPIPNFL